MASGTNNYVLVFRIIVVAVILVVAAIVAAGSLNQETPATGGAWQAPTNHFSNPCNGYGPER